MTPSAQRGLKVARVLDRDVAPIWHDRFARAMFRDLRPLEEGIVLDAAAETGRTTLELLARFGPNVRVVGLEPDPAKLELAKARIGPHFRDRVYLKQADPTDVAQTADDTYAAAFANLVLGETPEPEQLLAEFVRVVRPGGEVRATLPLRGTWAEVEDLLYEILLHAGASDAVRRLSRLARLRPTGPALADRLRAAGIDGEQVVVEQQRMQLVFAGGREFLFSPAVEHGPLRLWKAIIGKEHEPQQVFWQLKEAIDTYFARRVFCTTVVVGTVRIEVPAAGRKPLARRVFAAYPNLSRLFFGTSAPAADEEFDLDIDVEEEGEPAADVVRAGAEDDLEASFADLSRELSLSGDRDGGGEDGAEETAAVLGAMAEAAKDEDLEAMFEELEAEMEPILDDEPDEPAQPRPRTATRLSAVSGAHGAVGPPPPPPPKKRAGRRKPPPPPPKSTMRMRKPPPPPPPRGKKKP